MRSRSVPSHRWIVDRLNIDPVSFQQQIAGSLHFSASPTQTEQCGCCLSRMGRPAALNATLTRAARSLMQFTFPVRCFEMTDSRRRRRADCRGSACRENEAWCVRSGLHRSGRRAVDVATEAAEGLGERAFDDVDTVHMPSRAATPAPRGPYIPTAWTSSQ